MKHSGILFGVLLLLSILGCKFTKPSFGDRREYIGFSSESRWAYTFRSNGTYILEYEGHVGDGSKRGSYVLKDSIVILIADEENFES